MIIKPVRIARYTRLVILLPAAPVSYTHLDVYKRQTINTYEIKIILV